jgi:hypothetical protein
MSIEHKLLELAERTLEVVCENGRKLDRLLSQDELNDAIALTIPNQQGETNMGQPATLVLGQPAVQATAVESLKGVAQTSFNGPLAFSSDNAAIATVDPATGLVTQVAAGTCNITVLDAIGNLTDSVAVTVVSATPPPTENDSISLSIPSQTVSSKRRF